MNDVFALMSMGPAANPAVGKVGGPQSTGNAVGKGGFLSALMTNMGTDGQKSNGTMVSGNATDNPLFNQLNAVSTGNGENGGGENAPIDSLFSILQLAMKLGLIDGDGNKIGENPEQDLQTALDQLSFNTDGTLILNDDTLAGLSTLKQLYLNGDTPGDLRTLIDTTLNGVKSVKPSPEIMLSAIEQSMNDQLGLNDDGDSGSSVEINGDQNPDLLAAFEDVPARPAGDWAEHFALMVQAGKTGKLTEQIKQGARKAGLDTEEFLAAGIATGQITIEQVTNLANVMPALNVADVTKLTDALEQSSKKLTEINDLRDLFDGLKKDQKLAKQTEGLKKNASVERQQVQGDLLQKADLKQAATKAMELGAPAPSDGASADDIIQQFNQILGQQNKATGPQVNTQMMTQSPQMARSASPHPATDMVNMRIQKAMINQETHFKLQLHPKELGRVDVQLQFAEDGKLMTIISADRGETLNLLQKDAANLHRMLQNAGLNSDAGGMEFNLRGDNDQNEPNGEFGQQANGYPDGGSDDLSAQDVMAAIDHNQQRLIALGRIDLTV